MLPFYLAVEDVPVEESGPNPVIPNVGELIIGLLTFAIVVYVLMRYAWPRAEATFQARREAIEGPDAWTIVPSAPAKMARTLR